MCLQMTRSIHINKYSLILMASNALVPDISSASAAIVHTLYEYSLYTVILIFIASWILLKESTRKCIWEIPR